MGGTTTNTGHFTDKLTDYFTTIAQNQQLKEKREMVLLLKVHGTCKVGTLRGPEDQMAFFRISSEPTAQLNTVIGEPAHIQHVNCHDKWPETVDSPVSELVIEDFDENIDYRYQYFAFHYEHHVQYIVFCQHKCFHLRSLKFTSKKKAIRFFKSIQRKGRKIDNYYTPPGFQFMASIGSVKRWLDSPHTRFLRDRILFDSVDSASNCCPKNVSNSTILK